MNQSRVKSENSIELKNYVNGQLCACIWIQAIRSCVIHFEFFFFYFKLLLNIFCFYTFLKVVEYLVWAAVSTEMALPLLSISYLPWRSTLYCAACEAFYDSRTSPDAEVRKFI